MKSWVKIFLGAAIGLWLATGCAIISRIQLVFNYATLPLVPPEYEIIAGSTSAIAALIFAVALLVVPLFLRSNFQDSQSAPGRVAVSDETRVLGCWLASTLPLWLLVLRIFGSTLTQPGWWELAWFAGWTGLAVRYTLDHRDIRFIGWTWPSHLFLLLATVGCGWWWFTQSVAYHADHLLGFNDFGHFAQRISNTANGYGLLLESPVLPPFWDHFNPGLLLLLPLWMLYPHVELIFALQAACLSGSAVLIGAIARARGQNATTACGWGCAWLLYPSVGQMNLTYTYGWHPITLAVPCLLAAYHCWCLRRIGLAVVCALVSVSFEEGVFVVIACFAATQALRGWLQRSKTSNTHSATWGNTDRTSDSNDSQKPKALWGWVLVMVLAIVGFVIVYQFSGLATFQTSRFAKLGKNAVEIIASPVMRPDAFWGLLLRPRNFAFVVLMLIPFAAVASRAWLWSLVAIAPPAFVLMIWEHMPAQSLAFQYASCLIPILFVGIIDSPDQKYSAGSRSLGMLASVWVLAISIGQMPWSNDSLVDVKAKTYGVSSDSARVLSRSRGGEDVRWITDKIRSLRAGTRATPGPSVRIGQLPEWKRLRVLATGRLAAHCVGAGDVETVGQFWQRYQALKSLDPKLDSPILRYDIVLLDLRESFQQTREETDSLLREALQHGWSIHQRNMDFVILLR